jgi:hypothetical protein
VLLPVRDAPRLLCTGFDAGVDDEQVRVPPFPFEHIRSTAAPLRVLLFRGQRRGRRERDRLAVRRERKCLRLETAGLDRARLPAFHPENVDLAVAQERDRASIR